MSGPLGRPVSAAGPLGYRPFGPGGLLLGCFALSGATSLVLQVTWARRLTDIFGSSSLAIATVLAAFMGGLALGAALGGRVADRLAVAAPRSGPLLGYAVAEGVVGLAALAIPLLFQVYADLGPALWRALPDQPLLLGLLRLGLTGLALLVPTTAMGATLPLLGRHVTRQRDEVGAVGQRLGGLYAANTGGAVVGAAAAGFWLLPAIGVSASNQLASFAALVLAAGVAIVVAIVAWRQHRSSPEPEPGPEPPPEPEPEPEPRPLPGADRQRDRRLALGAYALSGAVAMALEVLFSRALAIVLGSSVYSFALVLVVFLSGIAAGSALAARPSTRVHRPIAALGGLLVGLGAAVALAHLLIDELPGLLAGLLQTTRLEVGSILTIHTVVAGLVITPLALGLGAVLPLAMRAYVDDGARLGRDVGRAYAANTVGAIAGALVAGFVVLPHLGLEPGVRAAAVVQAAAGLVLLLAAPPAAARRIGRLARLAAPLAVIAIALLAPAWNRSDLTAGLFRAHILTDTIEAGRLHQREVVFYRDGVSTTVSVERSGESWVLKNNGKVEASDLHDMPTQILVGLLPVLLHPGRDQSVFVVGYGSGVTVGAVTQSDRVARIDVAELEPAVYQAADRYFAEVSHHPARDRRVHRFVGDGKNVLIASDRSYDVIVSEPSNPWIAGVASLFTTEFYRLARSRLAPGGVFCQWAQLYELGPARVKMIYRTFHDAFPHVYAFTPGDQTTDTILIGSDAPLSLDLTALGERMGASPLLAAELARAYVETPADLVASLLLGPDEIAAFTAGAERNTDDNPLLEHIAPRDLLASVRENHFARAVRGPTWPYGHLDTVVTGLGDGPDRAAAELALSRALLTYGRRRETETWLARARRDGADAGGADRVDRILRLSEPVDFADPELVISAGTGGPLPHPDPTLFGRGSQARRRAATADLTEVYGLVAQGRWLPAWQRLDRLPARVATDAGNDVDLLAAYAAYKALDLVAARRLLRPLVEDDRFAERRPVTAYYLGRASYGLGAFRDGVHLLERFAARDPELAREVLAKRLPAR